MAAPNLLALTTGLGKTAYATPSTTGATTLLSNPAGSNKVFKVNQIVAANVNGTSAVDCTVTINSAEAGGGTAFPIASTIAVPADASLIVTDKTTAIYLEEDRSIVVTSGTANGITYSASYEELS
jgi:hypothetical protein